MSEIGVKLSGWKAVVVLVGILAFGGYKYVNAYSELDTQGVDVLKQWVAAEYQRYHLSRTDLDQQRQAQLLLATKDIQFRRVSARGSLNDTIVRVEIEPHPSQPPGSENIRYFRMEYSTVTGWRHQRDVRWWSYYVKLF